MVKSYLRYELKSTVGLINSQESNVVYDSSGKLVVSAAIENVLVWNPRQGVLVTSFRGDKSEVTSLQISPDKIHVAAGHADGSIRLYNIPKQTLTVTLQGHKKHVRSLRYNHDGSLLVSGSRDTDIIVWDVLSETGLYRLRGT
jgi:U3 small nucleolar RNA-associated protein 12